MMIISNFDTFYVYYKKINGESQKKYLFYLNVHKSCQIRVEDRGYFMSKRRISRFNESHSRELNLRNLWITDFNPFQIIDSLPVTGSETKVIVNHCDKDALNQLRLELSLKKKEEFIVVV